MRFISSHRRIATWRLSLFPPPLASLPRSFISVRLSMPIRQRHLPDRRSSSAPLRRERFMDSVWASKIQLRFRGTDAVHVTVNDAQGEVESKWLHSADLDFYVTLRPRAAGPVTVNLSSEAHVPEVSATLSKMLASASLTGKTELRRGIIAAAPNGSWQNAQPFELGQTIFGSDDERPFAPSKSEDGYAATVKGFQWFRFTFRENSPSLCTLC